jgi:hypothetical protein
MNPQERFAAMLVAMVGDDEMERMVEAQDEAHNPDDWGLDDDIYTEYELAIAERGIQ